METSFSNETNLQKPSFLSIDHFGCTYSRVESERHMFMVAGGCEGDLRKFKVILGARKIGVQH